MAEYPGSETERRIAPADLRRAVAAIFARLRGMDDADAALLAGALVNADQRGIHSHGTLRVPDYVDKLTKGGVDPRGRPGARQPQRRRARRRRAQRHGPDRGGLRHARRDRAGAHDACRRGGGGQQQPLRRDGFLGGDGAAARHDRHRHHQRHPDDGAVGRHRQDRRHQPAGGGHSRPAPSRRSCSTSPSAPPRTARSASIIRRATRSRRAGPSTPRGSPTTDAAAALDGLIQPIGGHKGVGLGIVMGMLVDAAFRSELRDRARQHEGRAARREGRPSVHRHRHRRLPAGRRSSSSASTRSAGRSRTAGAARASSASIRPGLLEWEFERRYAEEGIPLNDVTIAGIRDAGRKARHRGDAALTAAPTRLEPTHLPHAEVLGEAEPRSTHNGSPSAFWRILRGRPDCFGPAPQDEGVDIDHPAGQARLCRILSSIAARSCRALSAVGISTSTNLVSVCGCSWPIRSMSAEMTVPIMK